MTTNSRGTAIDTATNGIDTSETDQAMAPGAVLVVSTACPAAMKPAR